MAYELKPWKQADCSLAVSIARLSDRETFSREINERDGEGGALNADYRTSEAAMRVANAFGVHGLVYGTHFVFKTAGRANDVVFDFCDQKTKARAVAILAPALAED
jgi:hypothetical protein